MDVHQQNYQKILSLRATSEALDRQLTELLETLSKARKEVLSVPLTNFPISHGIPDFLMLQIEQSNANQVAEVPYDELLAYARKISKYTRPPQPSKYSHVPPIDSASISANISNLSENTNNGDSVQADTQAPTRSLPLGLSEEDVTALHPSSQIPFTPWPSEEVMKRGALSHMAYEEELRSQGLPIPEFLLNPNTNGQKADVEPAKNTPPRIETVTVQPQHHEKPREHHPPPGLSLSLDLYDPDED